MAHDNQKPMTRKLRGDFKGTVLERSRDTLNIRISGVNKLSNVNIILDDSGIQVTKTVPAEEQDITQSSVDKRAVQIGDVLGVDVDLPEDLKRLNGWLVYNITKKGVPQALEPKESAPEGVVTWHEANEHVRKILKEKGHENARLWTEADGTAIFNNVVKGGHNDKAQLDVSGSDPHGRYWERYTDPFRASMRYLSNGDAFWIHKSHGARVRAVQEVLELKVKL